MEKLNICTLYILSNQPTSLKKKNVHIFGIFQLIWLKFVMESLNGRVQHHGVQEQTLGQKKLSRLLTRWNVFSNALATYSAQKQKNRLENIAFRA